MSIESQFRTRYSTELVKQITNPQNSGATSEDTARTGLAASDVQGMFRIYVNEDYDETKSQHVAVAVKALFGLLLVYTGQAGGQESSIYRQIEDDMRALAKIGARGRMRVKSTSQLTPTPESEQGASPIRPDFDRPSLADLVPGPFPQSGDTPRRY